MTRLMPLVEASLAENPFRTCSELSQLFSASKELVRQCLHKPGFSYKKARYYGIAKNASALTKTFLSRRDAYIRESRPIYSVDETGFGRFSYQYRKGWAPRGKKLRIQKACARQTSTTVLACSSSTGWTKTLTKVGGIKRITFCSFIKDLDIPEGSVILLDNASIHRGDEVYKVFRDKKFTPLYVPPYSPWFNPIEGCFSIVKRQYPVNQNIQESFDSLTPQHFSAFFRTLKVFPRH